MSTGQMFERREMQRVISVHSRHLQRNIQTSLLSQIKAEVEGRCGTEGYIQSKSSVIIEYSLGRMNILQPGVRYRVKFQADVCFPHKGQILTAPVIFRSKIGIHAESKPLRILLPRDLHIGNTEFEEVQPNDSIEVEVLGAEFKQNDEEIFVLAKLIKRIPAKTDEPVVAVMPSENERASAVTTSEGETKRVVVASVATAAEEAKPDAKRRRRKLVPTGGPGGSGDLQPPSTLVLNVGGETEVPPGISGSK